MNSIIWKTATGKAMVPTSGVRSLASNTSLAAIRRKTDVSILFKQGFSLTARGSPGPSRFLGKEWPAAVIKRSAASNSKAVSDQTSTTNPEAAGNEFVSSSQMKREFLSVASTFSWADSPLDAKLIGLAGVLPYLGTSVITSFLSREVNTAMATGNTEFISPEMAHTIMNVMEPTQIGYGVVMLSFLSAINWGFQWSHYGGAGGPDVKRDRYLPGVLAPALAWSTLYMPFETALMTQFLGFVLLYNADAKKATIGLVPPWYANYRWVLTFVVGAAIFVTLVSREELLRRQYKPSKESYVEANKKLILGMEKRIRGEKKPGDRDASGISKDQESEAIGA